MTISTLTFQTNALAQMEALETALARSQTELSTSKKLLSAADNPGAMAQVNELSAQLSASQQHVSNGNAVTSQLQLEQNALTSATTALQSARDLAIQGNNSALTLSDRQNLVAQLQQLQQSLLAAANARDAGGNYLFGGTASGAPPFVLNSTAVSYLGNDQVNQVQISPDHSVSVGDAGSAVFMSLPAGNGTFTTAVGGGERRQRLDRSWQRHRCGRLGAGHLHRRLQHPGPVPGHQQRRRSGGLGQLRQRPGRDLQRHSGHDQRHTGSR